MQQTFMNLGFGLLGLGLILQGIAMRLKDEEEAE
jgi:hypothetical protein